MFRFPTILTGLLVLGLPLLGAGESPSLDLSTEDWTVHGQFTSILQAHPPIHSPYTGPASLSSMSEGRTSITSTLFLGRRLWSGGSLFVNPEAVGGSGLSRTQGIAGFPNGEIYRVSDSNPSINLARLYYQQIWGFSNATENLESDQNQLAGPVPQDRLTFVGGKFSLTDFFDANAYSHDPRTQFMNWSLFANGAWDYASDTRGYTYGFYSEYNRRTWAVRAATVMEPRNANQLSMDPNISNAHGDELEFEFRYPFFGHPGKCRPLAYWNHADMGNYQAATAVASALGTTPDVTATRAYSQKYGFGLNIEQELTKDLGFFSRLGWDDGHTETWAFTEIDRTASAGLSLKGASWHRPADVLASAVVVNGLSPDHRSYLADGGIGFIIGDGRLDYAPEQIWETYYLLTLWKYVGLTADVQLIRNPAYNADRGPVAIGAVRVHCQI